MLTRRRLLPLILLLLIAGCSQRVTTQQSATVYVHGSAAPGTLVHIYYPTGSETDAKAGPSGYWGQTVSRQSGTFELVASSGCITSGPAGATVRGCRATFKLPSGDTYGDFVVEVLTPTPTSAPTAPATPPPTASGSRLYICNDAAMVETIYVDGRMTVLVSCNEAGE